MYPRLWRLFKRQPWFCVFLKRLIWFDLIRLIDWIIYIFMSLLFIRWYWDWLQCSWYDTNRLWSWNTFTIWWHGHNNHDRWWSHWPNHHLHYRLVWLDERWDGGRWPKLWYYLIILCGGLGCDYSWATAFMTATTTCGDIPQNYLGEMRWHGGRLRDK